MMKYVLLLAIFFLGYSCVKEDKSQNNFTVEYKGALKNIMKKGDLESRIDLVDLSEKPHVYALGALENLKGEVLILDGNPWISSADQNTLKLSNTFNHKATLLVYSTVEKWTSIRIPEDVNSYAELEHFIKRAAHKQGLDPDAPFPFLIKGMASSIDWHVIDWPEGDKVHSHEKHITSGLHDTRAHVDVELLGFYSDRHHAIFTHHTTNMHMHVKSADNLVVGHVDDLTPGSEMILFLPE